jgi:hypothetical protein
MEETSRCSTGKCKKYVLCTLLHRPAPDLMAKLKTVSTRTEMRTLAEFPVLSRCPRNLPRGDYMPILQMSFRGQPRHQCSHPSVAP